MLDKMLLSRALTITPMEFHKGKKPIEQMNALQQKPIMVEITSKE